MNLQAGSSGSSALTVTSLLGFAGPVSLVICVNVPAPPCPALSVTGSASPSTVTLTTGGSATSMILIDTSPGTTTGSYSVWIYATGGGLVHQDIIDVGVGPYFTMGASPSSLTVPAGSTGSSTLVLTSHANFTFNANFQVSVNLLGPLTTCLPSCPVIPTISIAPTTVTLPTLGTASAMLTISTTSNTTQGTYTITVYGGGCVCILPTTSIKLTVTSPPSGNVDQNLAFDGVNAALRGSLTSTSNTVNGSITVTVTNATTGAIIFSKTFTILFTFISAQNPHFVMVLPVNPYTLGVTCSVDTSTSKASCFLSRDPDVDRIGSIGIIDVSTMALNFGAILGTPKYNPVLDLTATGTVSIVDLSIVLADYNAPAFS